MLISNSRQNLRSASTDGNITVRRTARRVRWAREGTPSTAAEDVTTVKCTVEKSLSNFVFLRQRVANDALMPKELHPLCLVSIFRYTYTHMSDNVHVCCIYVICGSSELRILAFNTSSVFRCLESAAFRSLYPSRVPSIVCRL